MEPKSFRHTDIFKALEHLRIGDLLMFTGRPTDRPIAMVLEIEPPSYFTPQEQDHIRDVESKKEDCVCNACNCYFNNTYVYVLWSRCGNHVLTDSVGFYVGHLSNFAKIGRL